MVLSLPPLQDMTTGSFAGFLRDKFSIVIPASGYLPRNAVLRCQEREAAQGIAFAPVRQWAAPHSRGSIRLLTIGVFYGNVSAHNKFLCMGI